MAGKNKVKALLVEKGIRQIEIAKALSVKSASVNGVVNGRDRSKRIEKYIADRLGLSPERVRRLLDHDKQDKAA